MEEFEEGKLNCDDMLRVISLIWVDLIFRDCEENFLY